MTLYIAKSGKLTAYNKDGEVKHYWDQPPVGEDSEELFMAESLDKLFSIIADEFEFDEEDLPEIVTIFKTENIGEFNVTFKYYSGDCGNFAQNDADEDYIDDPETSLIELVFLVQKCEQVEVTDTDFIGYKQQ